MDGLVESHLYGADDFDVGIERLKHFVGRACGGEVGEDEGVDFLAFEACEWEETVA